MLLKNGALLNAQNNYGETPLWLAARYGHTAVLAILIEEFNADICIRDYKNVSPLEISLLYENWESF